jgi:hypothetical protein
MAASARSTEDLTASIPAAYLANESGEGDGSAMAVSAKMGFLPAAAAALDTGAAAAAACRPVSDFSDSACAQVLSLRAPSDHSQEAIETYSACTNGLGAFPKSQPYIIGGGKKQAAFAQANVDAPGGVQTDATTGGWGRGAFVYSFVHIPKTGGSTVAVRLNVLARQSGGRAHRVFLHWCCLQRHVL